MGFAAQQPEGAVEGGEVGLGVVPGGLDAAEEVIPEALGKCEHPGIAGVEDEGDGAAGVGLAAEVLVEGLAFAVGEVFTADDGGDGHKVYQVGCVGKCAAEQWRPAAADEFGLEDVLDVRFVFGDKQRAHGGTPAETGEDFSGGRKVRGLGWWGQALQQTPPADGVCFCRPWMASGRCRNRFVALC